ncbi:MAG: biopolymer transporter ExbD [Chitinivibrionales bacterium]
MKSRNRVKEWEEHEMDLKPFMNLMVVLIPMLLLSAEFAKIAVVDVTLPEDRGSTRDIRGEKKKEKVGLTDVL